MGRACSKYGSQKRCIHGFVGTKPMDGGHLEDKAIEGKIILKWILDK
jgi:hypothetical protein